jgi:hypothetical protein
MPADAGGARILPPDFEWSPPDTPGRVACRTEVADNGGTNVVTLVREQDLPACVLDAGAYDSLLQATRDLIHPRMSTIMFEQ